MGTTKFLLFKNETLNITLSATIPIKLNEANVFINMPSCIQRGKWTARNNTALVRTASQPGISLPVAFNNHPRNTISD